MIPQEPTSSHPVQRRTAGQTRVFFRSLSGAAAGASLPLEPGEMHHLVHVRRLSSGAGLEAFDEQGLWAPAELRVEGECAAAVLLAQPSAHQRLREIVVYSAMPKGNRADWMIEKLAELGVDQFVPLRTQRAVVDPGAGKLARLSRIAREAAKQSRSPGVMKICPPMTLTEAARQITVRGVRAAVLATEHPGAPLAGMSIDALFIGPEGGWTSSELEVMLAARFAPAVLTETTLRVETAAICAAAIVLAREHG